MAAREEEKRFIELTKTANEDIRPRYGRAPLLVSYFEIKDNIIYEKGYLPIEETLYIE